MGITRRELAVAAVSATAMTQAQQRPAGAADPLQAARDRMKTNSDALAKLQVPMATEPAFQFKA